MDLSSVPLISLLSGRMSWLSQRQSVLATNVANADMPGYVARDMAPFAFERLVASQAFDGLATTDPRHIAAPRDGASRLREGNAFGEGGQPTGTIVSLEQEMIKLSDTQIQYQTAANLYQKAVNMFRTALGRTPA